MAALTLFYSYSHKDGALRDQLETHLSQLRREGLIVTWHDQQILAGSDRTQAIDQAIRSAQVILLLISADFLASDVQYHGEMQQALERHKRGEARVIPIVVRPCDWQHSPFAHLQCLPRSSKPVTTWDHQDEAFLSIIEELRKIIAQQQFPEPPLSSLQRQNRARMLKRVRDFWIKGFLEHSLHNAALIALGLHEQPSAVENPWRLMIQESELPERPLPAGTRITQVYDDADGELLILGEPGSGKTTLLLELARNLLDRADHDERHLMPIVFNLSSWAVKRQPLAEWLIEELDVRYQVPQKLGKLWVDTHQVLPLFDGLDEVVEEYRALCIGTINTYWQEQSSVPLVICSRTTEYLVQATKVLVRKAVVIQPLTTQQIDDYLEKAEGRLEGLQVVLRDDPIFRELANTPLMLGILALTYHQKVVEDITNSGSIEARRHQIFADYVPRMFQRRNIAKHYTLEQTRRWLTWLAKQMTQRHQTEFYIERMQLDWLPKNLVYRLCPSMIVGLIYGSCVGLIYGLYFTFFSQVTQEPVVLIGLHYGSIVMLLNWLLFVLLNGFVFDILGNSETEKKPGKVVIRQKFITFLESRVIYGLIFGLLNGFLVGWLAAINKTMYYAPNKVVHQDFLLGGIIYGLANLLFCAVHFGILGKLDKKIQPAEIVVWSWKSLRQNVVKIFASGLLVGLIYGVLMGLLYKVFLLQIALGLAFGLGLVLALVVVSGLSHETLSEQNIVSPNQGMRNSFRNSLVTGSASGLIGGIGLGLPQLLGSGLYIGSLLGLLYGLSVGLTFWFRNGGTACILHAILRVSFWMAHFAPLNYPRFLDFAAEHILLRKVGGSYIFVHRLLLEYFATLDEPASTENTSLEGKG